jgi:hypothetical protein
MARSVCPVEQELKEKLYENVYRLLQHLQE